MTNTHTDDLVWRETHERNVLKRDRAGAALHKTAQGAQNGTLAGTIGTNEANHLAGIKMEGHPLDGFHSAVMHPQITHLKHVLPLRPGRQRSRQGCY